MSSPASIPRIVALLVGASPLALAQSPPVRISLAAGGGQTDGPSSFATLAPNGRYVAFTSAATNLVPGDANVLDDVFVRDLATGTNHLVDVSTAGAQANWVTYQCAVSSNGVAAFASYASNLVPNDTLGQVDVFVRDLAAGTTTRISFGHNGNEANDFSYDPCISADGRYVAFRSSARNLVPGDTNFAADLFVHDRQLAQTVRVSVDAAGAQADGISADPRLTPDGRWLAFTSGAGNLVAGDVNGFPDVFVKDLVSGAVELVSVSSAGAQANGSCGDPAISADGRFVAFSTFASNLVAGDTNGQTDVFLHDRLLHTTVRISVGDGGQQGTAGSTNPALTLEGRRVAFLSVAPNLVTNDTNGTGRDVFLRDLDLGTTTCLDRDLGGGTSGSSFAGILAGSITPDGRALVFSSSSSQIVPGDTNQTGDLFLVDLVAPAGSPICFGDGSGAACPCGNAGAVGRGCENSFATGGGLLEGRGAALVAQDTVELTASFLTPSSPALFFQGTTTVNGGTGVAFVDGLRCAPAE